MFCYRPVGIGPRGSEHSFSKSTISLLFGCGHFYRAALQSADSPSLSSILRVGGPRGLLFQSVS